MLLPQIRQPVIKSNRSLLKIVIIIHTIDNINTNNLLLDYVSGFRVQSRQHDLHASSPCVRGRTSKRSPSRRISRGGFQPHRSLHSGLCWPEQRDLYRQPASRR